MATGIEKRRFADVQHAGAGFVARIARRMVRRGRRACAAARDSFYRYARSGRYTGAQRLLNAGDGYGNADIDLPFACRIAQRCAPLGRVSLQPFAGWTDGPTPVRRADRSGQIELTFEVVYGHAWKERARTSTSSPEGYGVVKLENILGRSKSSHHIIR